MAWWPAQVASSPKATGFSAGVLQGQAVALQQRGRADQGHADACSRLHGGELLADQQARQVAGRLRRVHGVEQAERTHAEQQVAERVAAAGALQALGKSCLVQRRAAVQRFAPKSSAGLAAQTARPS